MVMGEVSLCRIKELPPTVARKLRPALAKGNPAVLSVDRVRHELVLTAFGLDGEPGGAPLLARGPRPPVGHAPESCHWRVGKPFPQRFRVPARLGTTRAMTGGDAPWRGPVIRWPLPSV